MPSNPSAKAFARTPDESAFLAWQATAAIELERLHGIAAGAIPGRVWVNLYVRGLSEREAADRAEVYHRKMLPAGERWRKAKG